MIERWRQMAPFCWHGSFMMMNGQKGGKARGVGAREKPLLQLVQSGPVALLYITLV